MNASMRNLFGFLFCLTLVFLNSIASAELQLPPLIQGQCTPDLNSLGNFATPLIQKTTTKVIEDLALNGIQVEKTEYGNDGQGKIGIFDHPDFYTFALQTHFTAKNGRHYSVQSNTLVEDGKYAIVDELIVPIYVHDNGKGNSCEFIQGKDVAVTKSSMPLIVVVDDETKAVVSSGLYDALTVKRLSESKKQNSKRERKSAGDERSPIRGYLIGACQNGVGLVSAPGMRGSILGCQ